MKTPAILLSCITLAACSTPYQNGATPFSITGGYTSEQAPGMNLEKVNFGGNGYTSSKQVAQYVLRRAAEIGKEKHKAYFSAYANLSDAAQDKKITTPPVSLAFNKPESYIYVSYHNEKEPGDFSVTDILNK